mmetsp:Transcript_13021/g.24020  ORF Transcript_13021/g.24020 Transcript_13021/m.24020 type:complete len:1166 (-) Transcript_13021:2023-5520(-)
MINMVHSSPPELDSRESLPVEKEEALEEVDPEQGQELDTSLSGEKAETWAVRVGRRSGIMDLMDFMRRNRLQRQHHHRKVVDLTTSVNAAEMAALERGAASSDGIPTEAGVGLLGSWRRCGRAACSLSGRQLQAAMTLAAWVLWLFLGAVFYALHDNLGWQLGFFHSLNIGWSAGWVLPPDKAYEQDPLSTAFSLLHTLIGVLFSGFAVLYIAKELGSGHKGRALQVTGGGATDVPSGQQPAGLLQRWWAWGRGHLPRAKVHTLFAAWSLLGFSWHALAFHRGLPRSADFAVSTLTGAGYRGVPANASSFQFVLTALYAAAAIPLMRISEGLLIAELLLGSNHKTLCARIVEDISDAEVDIMNDFCAQYTGANATTAASKEQDHLELAEFTVLLALRVGAVSLDTVCRIKQRFQALDRRHEQRLSYEDVACGGEAQRVSERRQQDLVESSYSIRSLMMVRRVVAQMRGKVAGCDDSSPMNHTSSLEHSMWSKPNHSSAAFQCKISNASNTMPIGSKQEHGSTVAFRRRLSQVRKAASILEEPSDQQEGLIPKSEMEERQDKAVCSLSPVKSQTLSESDSNTLSQKPPSLIVSPSEYQPVALSPSREGLSQDSLSALSPSREQRLAGPLSSTQSLLQSSSSLVPQPESEALLPTSEDHESAASLSQPYQGRLTNLLTFEKTRVESFVDEGVIDDNPQLLDAFANRDSDDSDDDVLSEENTPVRVKDTASLQVSGSQRFSRSRGLAPSLARMESGTSTYGRGGQCEEEVTSPTLATITSQDDTISTTEGLPRGLLFAKAKFLKRPVQVKLAAITALRSGLEDAKKRRQRALSRALMSRSHALLRRAHVLRARRRASPRHKSGLATASFLFFDFVFNVQVQAVALWLLWLLCGTLFFLLKDELSWSRALYQSVNTGYGVFLSRPRMDATGHAFILLHLITGTLIVAGGLTLLATHLNFKKHQRQVAALTVQKTHQAAGELGIQERGSLLRRARGWALDNLVHLCLATLVLTCTLLSSLAMDWPLLDALYFSVSMMSTGGQRAIPEDSPDFHYLATAVLACLGVPLMTVSLGLVTHRLSQLGEGGQLTASISAPIDPTELALLQRSGLESVPGQLEISEFAMLMMLRIGALHPDFIKLARYRFEYLKEPGASSLSIHSVGTRHPNQQSP